MFQNNKRRGIMLFLFGLILPFLISFLLTSCATAPQAPGNTTTSPTLRADVWYYVRIYEKASNPNCEPKLVKTEVIDVQKTGGHVKSVKERWTVECSGKITNYIITLTPSPRGGTDFSISQEK